jgi:hypothetical protein
MYWGRYLRFNSWDIVTRPQHIADQVLNSLTDEFSSRHIVIYFAVITVTYYVLKLIDLAVWDYWFHRRLPDLDRAGEELSLTPLQHSTEHASLQ